MELRYTTIAVYKQIETCEDLGGGVLSVSPKDMREVLGLSKMTIHLNLNKLEELGYIKQLGSAFHKGRKTSRIKILKPLGPTILD